jgi:hypothetical protein
MCFPELNSSERTDDSFKERSQEDHHLGSSILEELNIGMVSQIPYEYMHLVCLGVMRKLFFLWRKADLKFRIPPNIMQKISDELVSLGQHIPNEFARKPRAIKEFERWKATEYRQILIYTGPVIFDILPKRIYNHFMCLHCAIVILCLPVTPAVFNLYDYAHELLHHFVKCFSIIYGKEYVSYNVHGL